MTINPYTLVAWKSVKLNHDVAFPYLSFVNTKHNCCI